MLGLIYFPQFFLLDPKFCMTSVLNLSKVKQLKKYYFQCFSVLQIKVLALNRSVLLK